MHPFKSFLFCLAGTTTVFLGSWGFQKFVKSPKKKKVVKKSSLAAKSQKATGGTNGTASPVSSAAKKIDPRQIEYACDKKRPYYLVPGKEGASLQAIMFAAMTINMSTPIKKEVGIYYAAGTGFYRVKPSNNDNGFCIDSGVFLFKAPSKYKSCIMKKYARNGGKFITCSDLKIYIKIK